MSDAEQRVQVETPGRVLPAGAALTVAVGKGCVLCLWGGLSAFSATAAVPTFPLSSL